MVALLEKLGRNEKLKSVLTNLSTAENKATYAIVAIAVAKGICRPICTLCDTKEELHTRKYAALREALTEVIAIPTYLLGSKAAGKLAEKFVKDPKALKIAKSNMDFLEVCLTTLLVIPGLCSLVVKPFTNAIMGKNNPKEVKKEPVKIPVENIEKPLKPIQNSCSFGYRNPYSNNGMRVG